MFFDEDEGVATPVTERRSQEPTSEARYYRRILLFRTDSKPHPKLRHTALWILHNCGAHPLLGLLPNDVTVDLHKLTSAWLNKQTGLFRTGMVPTIPNRRAWRAHNVVAHMLIGLFPCRATFEYHDRTAKEMNVTGWI